MIINYMFKIFEFDKTKLMYGPLSPIFLNFMEHGLATAVEFHTGALPLCTMTPQTATKMQFIKAASTHPKLRFTIIPHVLSSA